MHRRRLLAAIGASGAVGIAGCLGGEDGNFEFEASPARVPDAELSDAGYEGEAPESFEIDQSFEVAGSERQVKATTWIANYQNESRGAALFVASTPNATVAGQSVNPLVRADNAELLRRLLDRTAGESEDANVEDVEEVGSETRPILDTDATVTTFEARVQIDAEGTQESVPAFVHLATVEHVPSEGDDEDVIALVGVHPQEVDESETQLSLMETVEH